MHTPVHPSYVTHTQHNNRCISELSHKPPLTLCTPQYIPLTSHTHSTTIAVSRVISQTPLNLMHTPVHPSYVTHTQHNNRCISELSHKPPLTLCTPQYIPLTSHTHTAQQSLYLRVISQPPLNLMHTPVHPSYVTHTQHNNRCISELSHKPPLTLCTPQYIPLTSHTHSTTIAVSQSFLPIHPSPPPKKKNPQSSTPLPPSLLHTQHNNCCISVFSPHPPLPPLKKKPHSSTPLPPPPYFTRTTTIAASQCLLTTTTSPLPSPTQTPAHPLLHT